MPVAPAPSPARARSTDPLHPNASPACTLRVHLCGAGPTGALAALAMADAGWQVHVIDPLEATALSDRRRAYALTHSSRLLLQRLGLWAALEPRLTPFQQLHLRDLGAQAGLTFRGSDLPDQGRTSFSSGACHNAAARDDAPNDAFNRDAASQRQLKRPANQRTAGSAAVVRSVLAWFLGRADAPVPGPDRVLQQSPQDGAPNHAFPKNTSPRITSLQASSAQASSPTSTTQLPVGWILRHSDLMAVLLPALQAHPAISLHLGGEGRGSAPDPRQADLVLATDGPSSPTRAALGIGLWRWPYRQACLTVQVELRGSDGQEAWELLRPEGPFAVLPLGPRSAQLVWSAPVSRCQQRQELPQTAFLEQLAAVLPSPLEVDGLLEPPRSFPVALELAPRLYRGHTLLVGESAHRCHPVGGQGLNLCWRDVAELHRLARAVQQGRLPLRRLGSLYARRRWPDLLLTLLATDLMVRLFSNRSPLLLPLRRLALALLARHGALRRLSLLVMSEGLGQRWAKAP